MSRKYVDSKTVFKFKDIFLVMTFPFCLLLVYISKLIQFPRLSIQETDINACNKFLTAKFL